MPKRPSSMKRFGRQHVIGSKTLLRSVQNQFLTTLRLVCERRSRKRLVIVRSELLRQFVNTLTADYKYCRQNRENLWTQVPKHISRKLKTFFQFFFPFLKSTLNLEYFERKDQSQSSNITEIINFETGSYLNVQKAIFHATLRYKRCYPV